jgi:hypothetical protein
MGLISDADPHDNPGATVQENCMSLSAGKLTGRAGCREVWLDNATARGGGTVADITTLPDIIALTIFRRPEADYCVFLDSEGTVHYGRNPT